MLTQTEEHTEFYVKLKLGKTTGRRREKSVMYKIIEILFARLNAGPLGQGRRSNFSLEEKAY